MIKTRLIAALLAFSSLSALPQLSFAQEQPTEEEIKINFLTGKKVVRDNLSQDPEEDPRFKETWSKINQAPIYLSKVKDFDDLSF